MCLEIPSPPLLLFHRHKLLLEIAFAKALAAFALENFVERRRTVLDRFW
jgi:hypothetical protein